MPAGAWQRGDWKPTQRRQRGVGRASWDEDRKLEGDALGRRCRGDALQREWCLARRFAHRLCKHRQNCQDKRRAATPSTALLAHLAAVAPTVLPSSGCHNVSVSVTSAPVRLKSPRQPDSSWSNGPLNLVNWSLAWSNSSHHPPLDISEGEGHHRPPHQRRVDAKLDISPAIHRFCTRAHTIYSALA